MTRKVPLLYESKLRSKLRDLEARGIIEKAEYSSGWSSPIQIVPKRNRDEIRMCLDLRYVNQFIEDQPCILPNLDELRVFEEGAKIFSVIDLPDAFHLIELEERARNITTFSTPWGPYRYRRLCFGLKNSPAVFMKVIAHVLRDCKYVKSYMDDLLVVGKSREDHDHNLAHVLKTLDSFNIPVNPNKCKLRATEVEFIGHVFSDKGVSPSPKKIEALRTCVPPTTKEEVQSFLGMLSYVAQRWVANFADLTYPLRRLTHKGIHFKWESEQQMAFQTIIEKLTELVSLGYYSPSDQTELYADASPYGLGAILIQRNKKGEVRPIAFASKCLSKEDRSLSQTEREALACVWSIEYFDYFLRGGPFTLYTDHKALEIIFGIRKPTSSLTSARIARWLLRVQEYSFTVKYVPGRTMIADFLSRQLPKDDKEYVRCRKEELECIKVLIEDNIGAVTQQILEEATKEDEILSRIRKCLISDKWDHDLVKYESRVDDA